MDDKPRMTPTRRVGTLILVTALVSAAIGGAAGFFVRSPAQVAADAAPPAHSELTVAVEEGTITDPLLLSGVVALGSVTDLTPNGGGVVTGLPVALGAQFTAGTVIAEVNDRPVIYLQGSIPLLRDLRPGDKGEDVRRLQEGLRPWLSGEPDGTWGTATTRALQALYKAAGYVAPVDSAALQAELVFGAAATATVLSVASPLGGAVESPLIRATTSDPTVTAEVADATSQLVHIGDRVSVTGSAIGGAQAGTITAVGGLVTGDDGVSRATVTVQPDVALPAAAIDRKVEITVLTGADAEVGLIVPLSAIRSNATGGTYVLHVRGENPHRVMVTVEETGGGQARVTASDGDLAVGDLVVLGVQ